MKRADREPNIRLRQGNRAKLVEFGYKEDAAHIVVGSHLYLECQS
jgi:hypothetical protein